MTELIKRYPVLKPLEADIESMVEMVSYTFRNEGKLLLAGNGGSAADCEHISGEMLKVFIDRGGIDEKMKARLISDSSDEGKILASGIERGFPAIPLTSFISLTTAYANDREPLLIFSQLVNALGTGKDTLFVISTSGDSMNLVYAARTAKAKGLKVAGLLGRGGGKLKDFCDVSVIVPGEVTHTVQELHLPVYHYLCAEVEKRV